jgi:hypothetical protein
VEERIRIARAAQPTATRNSDSLTDQLSKLADLRASGALDDEEFRRAKEKLLNSSGTAPG